MVHTLQPTDHALAMAPRKASVAAVRVPYAYQIKSATKLKPLLGVGVNWCEEAVPISRSGHPLVRIFA